MVQSTSQGIRSASGRWVRRFAGTRAASSTVTHGTWVIVAVALGAVSVGALAVPQSPVHQWLACQIGHVSALSATPVAARSCARTQTGALTPPSSSSLAATFAGNDGNDVLATWNGSAWQTVTPPAGLTPAWYAEGPMLAAVFENASTSVTGVPEVQSGSGAWMALGANGPDQTSLMAWMGSSLYAISQAHLWRWNGTVWTDLGEPSAWGRAASIEYLAVNAVAHTVVVASESDTQGIGEYHNGAWSTLAYPPHAMQGNGSPTALAVNGSGTVSVASLGFTANYTMVVNLYQERAGTWHALPIPAWSNTTVEIDALTPDGAGLVAGWMGAGVGLWNGTTWTDWGNPGQSGMVAGLTALSSGRFAAATQGAGVAIGNGAGWTLLAGDPSVDAYSVSASQ